MDLLQSFCPNMDCPARGHTGRDNIRIHDHQRKRLRCTLCKKTFSHRTGTPFLKVKTDTKLITLILTLVAHRCPVAAIEAAFGFQRRTVRHWIEKAGHHSKSVHEAIVLQAQALDRVEVDEIFARSQSGHRLKGSRRRWCYVFSAISVGPRLWLGALVSNERSDKAARSMAEMVRRAARPGPLLVLFDGFAGYRRAFKRAFRSPLKTGKAGRPRLVVWQDLVLVQQVKQAWVVRLVHGTWQDFLAQWSGAGGGVVSTTCPAPAGSYIERLNATFRQRLSVLARRSRHLSRRAEALESALYLMGSVYNFCTIHQSLAQRPAQAAGLVEERWSVGRLLWHQVPPARWRPARHRGPLSKPERALLAQWGT